MKAAVLKQIEQLAIEDLPQPAPGYGEGLVQVKYAGVCGTDLHIFHGHHKTAKIPVVLGHEFVGELVEANGELGGDITIGENVLVQPYYSCGRCSSCIDGRDNICDRLSILGVHRNGSFAEYVVVPLKKTYRVPAGMDLPLAALAEPLAVAIHDVRTSGLQVGQSALVIGGGPIGILIALIARLNGASKVVISEVNQHRCNFAQELGFTTINPLNTDVVKDSLKLTNGQGFDVVFEASGASQGVQVMTEVVKIGGVIVIIGVPANKFPFDTGAILAKELAVRGVRLHSQHSFVDSISILDSGVLDRALCRFVDHIFPLDEIEFAIRDSIQDLSHIKTLIRINP